jgi:hypothetical protein
MAMEAVNQNPAVSTSGIYQITLSADPSVAPGKIAPAGTTASDGTDNWRKWGPDATDWVKESKARVLELVDKQTLGAKATTISFAGLDGDALGRVKITLKFSAGHAAGYSDLSVTSNAGALTWTEGQAYSTAAVVGAAANSIDTWVNTATGSAEWEFDLSTGRARTLWGASSHTDGAATILALAQGVLTDTATNITGIELVHSDADGFNSGTVACLYRYKEIG